MPFTLLRLAAIAVLFAGACSGSTGNSDDSPGNLSITPEEGCSSAPVATVIAGTGFLAKATVPEGGGEPTLDTKHRAWIGDHELTGVTWHSTTKLDATVPADVPPGRYDLIVENALGNRGTLKAAYTVRDTNCPVALTAAPVITSAAPGDGQVTLTWTAPASNGAPISGYVITADRGVGARTTPSPATTFSFDGLTNGMAYTFTVAAVNSAGTGPASAPSAAVTPLAVHAGADMGATVRMSDIDAPAGEYVTGTATCTNGGPDVATNPTCNVTGLPAGATLSCTPAPLPATLASGAAITCSMYFAMPAVAVTVTVTAGSATADRTPTNNTASATVSLTPH